MTLKRALYGIGLAVILWTALYTRSSGLFRGLHEGHVFHPDVPKQVVALSNYLNGHYVWYTESPFYDGYPYGLNHVDEFIIRLAYLAIRPIHDHLNTKSVPLGHPEKSALYYWAGILRLLYGALVVIMMMVLSGILLRARPAVLGATLLLAIAPLSFTVTHFATGDIGVDLFVAGVLLALCRYAGTRRTVWLFLAGISCGFAFACKYHGALAFFIVAMLLFLEFLFVGGTARALTRKVALSSAGFMSGAVWLTPALFINPKRTWHDMRVNFDFIRNYGADPAILEKPVLEKIWHGLSGNLPHVVSSLGWVVSLLALTGLFLFLFRLWRERLALRADPSAALPTLLIGSVTVFFFFALLLSTALKPAVQPFHFSYLQLPLCLVAGWMLLQLVRGGNLAHKALAVVFFCAAIVEFGIDTNRELFFWNREDTQQASRRFAASAFRVPMPAVERGSNRQVLKYFFLEGINPAVFRNRPYKVLHDDPEFWNRLAVAPVPAIPFPGHCDWIFLNGPVLPRNDRLFSAAAGETTLRDIVAYGKPPKEIFVGLRTGSRPAEVVICLGGKRIVERLSQNDQKLVSIDAGPWRMISRAAPDNADVNIASLRVLSRLGNLWVNIMTTPREIDLFRLFGGDTADTEWLEELPPNHVLATRLEEASFLSDDDAGHQTVSNNPVSLLPRNAPLSAGVYILECTLHSEVDQVDVSFEVVDPSRAKGPSYEFAMDWNTKTNFILNRGMQTIRYMFSKAFAPYEINIEVASANSDARCEIVDWRIYPNANAILEGLENKTAAPWLSRFPPHVSGHEMAVEGVTFGRDIVLKSFSFPETLAAGELFHYGFRLDILDYHLRNFDDLALYVHLDDKNRRTLATFDFPLRFASFGSDSMIALRDRLPLDFPPGEYTLAAGIYNTRSQRRLIPSVTEPEKAHKGAVKLQTITTRLGAAEPYPKGDPADCYNGTETKR